MPAPTSRHPGPTSHVVPSGSCIVNFRFAAVLMNPRPKAVSARPISIIGRMPSTYVGNQISCSTPVRNAAFSGSGVAIQVHRVSARAHSRIECERTLRAMRAVGSVCARRSGGSGGNQYEFQGSPTRTGGTGVANRLAPSATSHQITTSNHSATIPARIAQPARIARNFHRAVDSSSKPIHELTQNARPRAVMSSSSRNRPDPRSCLKRPSQLN
jgi:hypothetical protein